MNTPAKKKPDCARCEGPIQGTPVRHEFAPYAGLPLCAACDKHLTSDVTEAEPEEQPAP